MRAESVAVFCIAVVLFMPPGPSRCEESSVETGTLRIDGSGVETLVLFDGGGHRIRAACEEGVMRLPASIYTVREIHLAGGPYCRLDEPMTFEVEAGAETTLSLGGPLSQTVEVRRNGTCLDISHWLEDVRGYRYRGRVAGAGPPVFAVYKNGREVGAGTFEYG
ncbi:MAG TPA: hypothetical protein ENN81_06135 [Phycisphaerales bacterium]|nr:hypothetical protein [Phycisphaerales bacterium]